MGGAVSTVQHVVDGCDISVNVSIVIGIGSADTFP